MDDQSWPFKVLLGRNKRVWDTMALTFQFKSTLRKKKNYGNSNISPCKNIIYKKKSSKRNQKPSRYYNFYNQSQVWTQAKISSFKNPHIKTGRQGQNLCFFILFRGANQKGEKKFENVGELKRAVPLSSNTKEHIFVTYVGLCRFIGGGGGVNFFLFPLLVWGRGITWRRFSFF